jgi:hypothetical protein
VETNFFSAGADCETDSTSTAAAVSSAGSETGSTFTSGTGSSLFGSGVVVEVVLVRLVVISSVSGVRVVVVVVLVDLIARAACSAAGEVTGDLLRLGEVVGGNGTWMG